jgi:RNA polymerase sigma-70 factor (ECF subfamily)
LPAERRHDGVEGIGEMPRQNQRRPPSVILSAFQSVEPGLKQYVTRFVLRHQDIEDIVQETFLRAYESEQSQEIRAPKSFLFRVARNIALNEIARKANSLTDLVGDLDSLDVIDNRPTAEQQLEIRRSFDELNAVIGALPRQCRRVLVMRKVFGLSHKEIARRMDISVRTVEKHLAKALQRCQDSRRQEPAEAGATVPSSVRVRGGDD